MNLLDMEINESLIKKLIIVSLIIIFIYGVITVVAYSMLKPYNLEKDTTVNDEKIKTGISVLEQGSIRLKIKGWAYKSGDLIQKFNSSFILRNKETGKMYLMKTAMETVEQLTLTEEGQDCSKAGMSTECMTIGLKKGIYDICILYKNDSENILAETAIEVAIQ